MKAIKFIFVLFIAALLSSCVDREVNYHAYTVNIAGYFEEEDYPDEYLAGAKVVFANLTKNFSFTKFTNDSGDVQFTGIEPGFYSATLVHSIVDNGKVYYLNGLEMIDMFDEVSDSMKVVVSETNAFVIKQYYYSGSTTPAGNSYSSDQFVEIYNNSDTILYADGLSIVEHESYAIEENYWTFIEDTIVARAIWTIPGDGDDYPMDPGTSVVIARDGINHQDDSLGNPLSPVNLEHADFEYWVERQTGGDIDGPFAENMVENLFTFRGSDYVFHTRGGSAIALVLFPGTQEEKQEFIDNHQVLKITSSDRYYGKVPNEYVLDAAEITWDEAHAIYKRFPLELDAGYTYVPAGSKSGLCVRRKVKEVIEGRFVYQDTNNSTEDFEKDVVPKPWINEE